MRVALVGVDGTGKSTLTRMLLDAPWARPARRIYMGINLEASSLMLPTTRLLLAAKRARGGRPDLVAGAPAPSPTDAARQHGGALRSVKDAARLVVWMLEEWFRQLVAATYAARGYLIIFDRDFFADYYHAHVAPPATGRPLFARLHGWMLLHVYPKPDLTICVDAPAEVLYARKPESGIESLAERRQQYLALADVIPDFVVVDGDRPLENVFTDVVESILAHWKVTDT
jgi:thymidylate kinase